MSKAALTYESAPAGYDQQLTANRTIPPNDNMQLVAVSQTDKVLGATGAVGDYLDHLLVIVATAGATSVVSIKDGTGSAIPVTPAIPALGTYNIPIGKKSETGPWKITTLAGATVLAFGKFTA